MKPARKLAQLERRQAKRFNPERQRRIDNLRYQINTTPYRARLIGYAEDHRKQPTTAEAALKELLDANLPLRGLTFKEQEVIGRHIADFVIPAHRLVIEVDGPYHLFRCGQDHQRTRELNGHGHRVIRFTNDAVLNQPFRVLAEILRACKTAYELASDAYLPERHPSTE